MAAINSVTDLVVEDGVAIVTLNSPPVNALSAAVRDGLYEGFKAAIADDAAKSIVLICDGRTFIAGADISEFGGASKGASLFDVQTMMEDSPKAVIAAIHLDAGFEVARAFVEANWSERMLAARGPLRDAKTTLQEWLQGRGLAAPAYRQVSRSGPDHDPVFTIAVAIDGAEGATGTGRSKREAEQNAATSVLVREGLWKDASDA